MTGMANCIFKQPLSHAIVRPPDSNFVEGLTAAGLGSPDLSLALKQHRAYCGALRRCGLSVPHRPFGARTNEAGARQLSAWLKRLGYETRIVDIRNEPGLLHLKGGIAALGEGRLAVIEALKERPEFFQFNRDSLSPWMDPKQ